MLVAIMFFSFLAFFAVFIYAVLSTKTNLPKILGFTVATLFLISLISFGILGGTATSKETITSYEISEVYEYETREETAYFVRLKDTQEFIKVETARVCLGEEDVVICYSYDNMTSVSSFFLGMNKTEYVLVVTDTNIPSFPVME